MCLIIFELHYRCGTDLAPLPATEVSVQPALLQRWRVGFRAAAPRTLSAAIRLPNYPQSAASVNHRTAGLVSRRRIHIKPRPHMELFCEAFQFLPLNQIFPLNDL